MRRLARALLAGLVAASSALAARADAVRVLADPRDALLARRDAVEAARDEVLVQSFIFGDDDVTFATLALLRDAARRGRCVNLLVDAQWNRIPGPVLAHLQREGVHVREYHAFRMDRLWWIPQRMHEKVLVVDGAILVAGGRNVESPYFGEGAEVGRRDYVDCDVEVRGAAAETARLAFMDLWESRQVRKARRPTFPEDIERAERRLDAARAWLDRTLHDAEAVIAATRTRPVEAAGVRFLHDRVGRKGLEPGIERDIHAIFASAKESLVIETPYLVPSRRLRREIREARRRGVRIRVLTNSLGTTDNLWPQAAYAGDKHWIVGLGVELWEYMGPECIHSKTAVVDGRTCIVGSFNFHPRSEHFDTEVAVVAESPELAAILLGSMDGHLSRAARIGPDGRPEGSDERHPGVKGSKIARMQALRVLVPLVRRQL